jgi:predicted permease
VLLATLALGIGANAAIFTLVNAVLLRPLPVPHPEQLVALGSNSVTGGDGSSSTVRGDVFTYPVYRELRERNAWVTGLLASGVTGRLDVLPTGDATELEHPSGRFVSGNYFEVLQVGASVGRTFDGSEDDSVGRAPVVVLSHGYWMRRFAGDPTIIGQGMTIDGVTFTVIGVAARGFSGEIVGEAPDVWIPITMQPTMMPNDPRLDDHRRYWIQLIGRVRPEVTLAQAESGFRSLIRQVLIEEVRLDPTRQRLPSQLEISVGPGATGFSALRDDYSRAVFTLVAGVGLLLLIVCANVGNLLLVRAVARTREMAVRVAIGAGHARLVRQMLTESAVLSLLAGAAGLLVARWGSLLLIAMASEEAGAIPLDMPLDFRVLLFTAALSLSSVLLFGLTPAYRARHMNAAPVLRSQRGIVGTGDHRGRIPLGKALIVGQVTLSLVLLAGASLLLRSVRNLERTDPGFDRDHLLVVDVDDASRGYSGARHLAFARELSARFAALPRVAAVSFSMNGLFAGSDWSTDIDVPGFTARTAQDSSSRYDVVGPGYASTIGARLIEGREFTERDTEGTPPVILVNQSFARFYLGDENAVGRTVVLQDSSNQPFRAEIIGVVSNVRTGETTRREGARSLTQPPVRRFYVAYLQHPGSAPPSTLRFVIRAAGDPAELVGPARRIVSSIDASLPIDQIYPLRSRIRESIARERLLARLTSGFGTLALLLAALGLYGVMTYNVNRRTGELGLRMALGAERIDIVTMVLKETSVLVGIGLAIGLPAAYGATRILRTQVDGVGPIDPVSAALAFGVVVTASLVAALVPALRAARVAPMVALVQE